MVTENGEIYDGMKTLKVEAVMKVGIDSDQMKEDVLDTVYEELSKTSFDWNIDWKLNNKQNVKEATAR